MPHSKEKEMKHISSLYLFLISLLFLSGCSSMSNDYDEARFDNILVKSKMIIKDDLKKNGIQGFVRFYVTDDNTKSKYVNNLEELKKKMDLGLGVEVSLCGQTIVPKGLQPVPTGFVGSFIEINYVLTPEQASILTCTDPGPIALNILLDQKKIHLKHNI